MPLYLLHYAWIRSKTDVPTTELSKNNQTKWPQDSMLSEILFQQKKDKKQAALLLGSCYLSFISADSTQIWWFTGMLMPHPTWLHWPEKDSGYLSPNFSFQAAWMDEWLICRLKQLGENDYDWDTNSFSGQFGNAGCDQQCLLLFIHL